MDVTDRLSCGSNSTHLGSRGRVESTGFIARVRNLRSNLPATTTRDPVWTNA
ncbi:hypothetical protein [Halalkalicoccus jeotgali]|uniref:Uncharacterized protein n=1 Tax=Halalkalicoccus jeotgali (strain DSM 18796 / CECT 7217 / JCM 14584 / KCTC 4019 / B3) TaxID=795797 RepID=D8J4P8_HALJB|nr:hypothetical protein [Halalkalicoccus jeotgali]ADJ15515.1 hypothetical protein HacjB3_10660 [Halalkalicoccus jeotgali B3]ELY36076.1 hypothetical protein C497_12007 [Halalkalicoccus jeotgali B3]